MPIALTGGGIKNPSTGSITGTLILKLSQDAKLLASPNQIVPAVPVAITVTSGNLAGGTSIYGTDELTPTNLYYTANIIDTLGNLIYGPEKWRMTGGGSLDVGKMVPQSDGTWAGTGAPIGGGVASYWWSTLQHDARNSGLGTF